MERDIIRDTDYLEKPKVEVVGGKAAGLIELTKLAEEGGFDVPEFFVIPVNYDYSEKNLRRLYKLLEHPLAVRSSSPYEDSKGYSFAGMFKSRLNVNDEESFIKAVYSVTDSAHSFDVHKYAQVHGLTIDNKMAVIVQKMIDPNYSGVCYSTSNSTNPKTFIEYVSGLSDNMMLGDMQGSIASFDRNFRMVIEYGNELPRLARVARVAKYLEGVKKQKLDIEFAVTKGFKVYIVQARPVTDTNWKHIELPTPDKNQILLTADIVRGSGNFTGPVFVRRSPTELYKIRQRPLGDFNKQADALVKFDKKNPDGYCLITDTLENHLHILEDHLANMKALVTVNYASRFSHPIKIVSEMGIFYLGVLGRKDLIDTIKTGDTISVASDESRGVIYKNTRREETVPSIINVNGIEKINYSKTSDMISPSEDEVDDKIFLDPLGEVGIYITDYNQDQNVPTQVYYHAVNIKTGQIFSGKIYDAKQVAHPYPSFKLLLDQLLINSWVRLN